MKKVVGLVLGLLPVSAVAECVPVPDCVSIGYSETTCDGDSLKCPFDVSKLKCLPCDSSYRYTCDGANVDSAVGEKCNGKYVDCECIDGAIFSNGECICNESCDVIGNFYYADGTCSSCNLANKTAVGIVVYKSEDKHLIANLTSKVMRWSTTQKDANGNEIINFQKDISGLINYSSRDLALQDYNGFDNTQIIVEAYGENATGVAAVYCYNYTPVGLESSKGQWYLPALGELYGAVYVNKINITNTKYWSSTENCYTHSWYVRASDGANNYGKGDHYSVRCFLDLNLL